MIQNFLHFYFHKLFSMHLVADKIQSNETKSLKKICELELKIHMILMFYEKHLLLQ